MRHFLEIKARSAKLACGPAVGAYFPMQGKALKPSGIGEIAITLSQETVTCERCLKALAAQTQEMTK